ncbi:alpha/beta hydrolase [Mycolicibacterium sp.]|uniref:alpha/beta hydrolase n=1 Tax=Mycolicibacterium sp. TaxID=2320850 RepID=UPI003D0E726D
MSSRFSGFPGFAAIDHAVNGVRLRGRFGGDPAQPAVLLLHGHPESHLMWHRVAPALARDHFVVAPDLRGYGESERPAQAADHSGYSKREMARDCLALMETLGHRRFFVAGHDRGARVAARLAADAPERVAGALLMDVAPTVDMYDATTKDFAVAYWHWFFLIQPAPLPETLIGANPRAYVEGIMGGRHAGLTPFPREVLDGYIAGFTGAERARGACEDYRAAATIDLEHDRRDRAQGRLIEPPLRLLWARHGVIERLFRPLQLWGELARTVSGRALDCGHYLTEERPDDVIAEIRNLVAAE